MTVDSRDQQRLEAARTILQHIATAVEAPFSVRLWDGSMIPLGPDVDPRFFISLSGPGVIGSILRRPTLENVLRHYASGQIDFHGGDLMAFGEVARSRRAKARLRGLSKSLLLRHALPLLTTPPDKAELQHGFASDETGRDEAQRKNQDFIQFHYDVSNEFYQLWLDPEMQYSCAYYTDWDNSLEQAQLDKLEMICRKLRLLPGEKMLDIGCGWGGLLCYAAQHYGVHAHGVTLSQRQYDFAQEKIKRLGLEDRVTIDLRDYATLEGSYDKIVSVGMYEHIGIANYPQYFRKVYSLLRDRGIFLNHGITRRAKANRRNFQRITPEKRLILKYIFPGSELDHIGHTVEVMEATGFEVHDVEAWREHYALTTKYWCQRLTARREEAIKLVGSERYRLWVAYLAAVSFNFTDGPLRIYQVVTSKHGSKGLSGMPPTRRHLYTEMPCE
jgi:cyclopropane-fatty-acyl-phospholipid synthase